MIRAIIGPPKGGKSAYAEELLKQSPGPHAYIACLPNNARYQARIAEHRSRRPESWHLCELSGDPDIDLAEAMHVCTNSQSTLFDGLSFYLLRLFYSGRAATDWRNPFSLFIRCLAMTSRLVLVVDAPAPPVSSAAFYHSIIDAHQLLYRQSQTIAMITGGQCWPLTALAAIQLDLKARPII